LKVYLDSGVFIDYLIGKALAGSILRRTARRGRSPQELLTDAETCFAAIAANHVAITSSLTCYEVEEALYRALATSPARVAGQRQLLVAAARAALFQILVTADLFKITLIDLTKNVFLALSQNAELLDRGVRAADALHVTTALHEGADLLITTDARLARLDGLFSTVTGAVLRCRDTHEAIPFL
jgi:predicted nucleic acid-binding protein